MLFIQSKLKFITLVTKKKKKNVIKYKQVETLYGELKSVVKDPTPPYGYSCNDYSKWGVMWEEESIVNLPFIIPIN